MSSTAGLMARGPIPPAVHGVLDYLLAGALIAGPLLIDFDDSALTAVVLVIGGAATLLAIGTDWATGLVRLVPPIVHGILDIGATVALIALPFALGATDDGAATAFCLVLGAGGLAATLMTRFKSDVVGPAAAARASS